MGELRGGRPDQPSEEPDKPAPDRVRPPTDSNNDPRAVWRAIRQSDHVAFEVPDGTRPDQRRLEYRKPADSPADRLPPTGEELVEKDAPEASRVDKVRKRLFDKEVLPDLTDVTEKAGRAGLDLLSGSPPTGKAEVCVPQPIKMYTTPHQGVDGGQILTGMLVVGLVIGEGTKRAYRMTTELKERAHGRVG